MKHITRFIFASILITLLSGCDGMAALFHGPKPEKPPVTWTLSFDANGATGSAPAAQTVNAGTVVGLPNQGGMASAGNVFVGWNENAGGGGTSYAVGASVTVTRDMVFYAQWFDSLTPQYTVTFNANGATGGAPPAAQTVYSGISITVPNQGSLGYTGKIFDGWNTAANGAGTTYAVGASFQVSAPTTLYAKWRSAVQYTVTYHANGAAGTAPAARTVDPGTEITLPGAGSLNFSGRNFDGWNTIAGGTGAGYAEGASYTVNANAALYAQWISTPIVPEGATLAQKLAYIAGRADDSAIYNIEITQDESLAPTALSTMGRNVTINLYSASASYIKKIMISASTGYLFQVGSDITLKLENIILQGSIANNVALLRIASNGKLTLNTGATITGNKASSTTDTPTSGGGIIVEQNGNVIIYDGLITANEAKQGRINGGGGGGIYIKSGGTVAMYGGIISNNKASAYAGLGGGINIETGGHFVKTSLSGGGTSGIIYGNDVGAELANTMTDSRFPAHAISWYGVHKIRSSTVNAYTQISTENVNLGGWEDYSY